MKQILTYLCSLIIVALIAVPAQAETVVAVDIKPGSCPNSLNVNSGGVLPVAILGTADFDVTTVDIPSVTLEGVVSPLRWDFTMGSEGMLDLTYKFDMWEVVEALGEVSDGEFRVLSLTGVLLDGTPIMGDDVVRILKKGQ
jgi:hypothetical protein